MRKISAYFGATILICLLGCTREHGTPTNLPYLFVDHTGKEYRGFYTQYEMPEAITDESKSGSLLISYENGQKWLEGTFADGKLDGTVKMWRQDGTLFIEEHYDHGVRNGKLIWWYPSGQKEKEVDWVNGKKNGLWIEWDENGNETSRRLFKDDRRVEK